MKKNNVMEIDLRKLKVYECLKNDFETTKEQLDYFDNEINFDRFWKELWFWQDFNKEINLLNFANYIYQILKEDVGE